MTVRVVLTGGGKTRVEIVGTDKGRGKDSSTGMGGTLAEGLWLNARASGIGGLASNSTP